MSEPTHDEETFHLHLFVAGNNPSSIEARHDLEALVRAYLEGRCVIEITDIVDKPEAALEHRVVATPMLVLTSPPPKVTIIGRLSATNKILAALRISKIR